MRWAKTADRAIFERNRDMNRTCGAEVKEHQRSHVRISLDRLAYELNHDDEN
jgi:hypothetical protein